MPSNFKGLMPPEFVKSTRFTMFSCGQTASKKKFMNYTAFLSVDRDKKLSTNLLQT